MDEEASSELAALAEAHLLSALRLAALMQQAKLSHRIAPALVEATADEALKRQALIAWRPPSTRLVREKLFRLLVHAIAADIGFDELSLARISADVAQYMGRTSHTLED